MKNLWIKALVLSVAAAMHSHALFGVGMQWAPAPGLEAVAESKVIASSPDNSRKFILEENGVSGLQGLGLKLWLDFLPLVDLEAATNLQFGYYDLNLSVDGQTVPVEAKADLPFVRRKPVFARVVTDLSALYPFIKFPPAAAWLKVYVGGGLTHALATQVLTPNLAETVLEEAAARDAFDPASTSGAFTATLLADGLVEESLKQGLGFHVVTGAKAKVPVVPLAFYANVKYHILMIMPSVVDATSLGFELGAGLTF